MAPPGQFVWKSSLVALLEESLLDQPARDTKLCQIIIQYKEVKAMHKWLKLNGSDKSRQTVVLKRKTKTFFRSIIFLVGNERWLIETCLRHNSQNKSRHSYGVLGKTFLVTGSFLSCQNRGLNYEQPYWMLICANVGDLCPSNPALEGSMSVCESSTSTILLLTEVVFLGTALAMHEFLRWASTCACDFNVRGPR